MRALWIEDHPLIADALELLLQVALPTLSLDKARTLAEGEQLVASIPYSLVLLDWWLDAHDGAHSLQRLRERGCLAPVVVVSGDDRELVMRQAWALGVAGFVRKSGSPQELLTTLQAALAGQRAPLPPAAPRRGLPTLDPALLYPDLSPRQLEVLRALLRGASDRQIAEALDIGETTVKSHVRAVLQALGVRSRNEAAHVVRRAGG